MHPQSRIALVTGGAHGIGLATVRALLDAGNRVAIADCRPLETGLFPEETQGRIMRFVGDVRDAPGMAACCADVLAAWGPIGILVNNAGISPKQTNGASAQVDEVSREEWAAVLEVNTGSILRLVQAVVPQMREAGWGRIINIASLAGRTCSRVAGVSYSVSKAALIGLTRNMADELGPFGITANAVAPGRILTDMARQGGDAINADYAALIPVRRLGAPEEVAALIAFLASEESGFINGASIDINGGFFMN